MKTVVYDIDSISCHHCKHTIENEVSDLAGVKTVEVDVASRRASIVFETPATEGQIKALLEEINYPVTREVAAN